MCFNSVHLTHALFITLAGMFLTSVSKYPSVSEKVHVHFMSVAFCLDLD